MSCAQVKPTTTRMRLFFAVAILALMLTACPVSSTLMLSQDEMIGVMQGDPWPEGK